MIPGVAVELQVAGIGLVGTALLAIGTLAGIAISSRVQRRAAEVQAVANKKDAENKLIDQLQEELVRYREANDRRATEQDARMNRLEARNDELTRQYETIRTHAHELRAHIWDEKGPPPPAWPAGAPR